jgi:hypothetical protein
MTNYMVVSRNGTGPLSKAVQVMIDEGWNIAGGVTTSKDTVGRKTVTIYHQALILNKN